jgi:hypothetical protein
LSLTLPPDLGNLRDPVGSPDEPRTPRVQPIQRTRSELIS